MKKVFAWILRALLCCLRITGYSERVRSGHRGHECSKSSLILQVYIKPCHQSSSIGPLKRMHVFDLKRQSVSDCMSRHGGALEVSTPPWPAVAFHHRATSLRSYLPRSSQVYPTLIYLSFPHRRPKNTTDLSLTSDSASSFTFLLSFSRDLPLA